MRGGGSTFLGQLVVNVGQEPLGSCHVTLERLSDDGRMPLAFGPTGNLVCAVQTNQDRRVAKREFPEASGHPTIQKQG